ncbi:MAG: hypothetical protein QNK25_07240 [Desulfobacterales bacterium]|nr:hypothetical protein [Desulfobacterales bacterium]
MEKEKETNLPEYEEMKNQDFQFVLKELLGVYQPILERELERANDPEKLKKEAEENPPDCEDEFILANRLFEKFFTEKVALRLLPEEGRKLLGPIEQWRWCFLHIRCCIIFGWLVCRRQRTFRGFAYYLYHYWRCVRRVLNIPVSSPPTLEEQKDFAILVKAFAGAYKPFLTDQLASLEFIDKLPEEILEGNIDCLEGEEDAMAVFQRALTVETASALLGKKTFEEYKQAPFFWFCRCWCLCGIRFGCCLAKARNLIDVLHCLLGFWHCTRNCIKPLTCELTDPVECMPENVNTLLPALGLEVKGTAGGAGFHHYILEWSKDNLIWHTTNFHYLPIPPGGGSQGTSPVFGGVLAFLDTTSLDDGPYFIRMTVYSVHGTTCVCKTQFSLFKQDVRILGIDGAFALNGSEFDPAAQLVETVPALCSRPAGTFEVSFAKCLGIWGSAFVGGCEGRKIKRYTIDYKPGFETDCSSAGWLNIWNIDYNTIWQYREMNMRRDTSVLTSKWVPDCVLEFPAGTCLIHEPDSRLKPSCWQTHTSGCELSGLVTLRLVVEDTVGNLYCDTQRVWIDNKQVCAMIRIDAVPKCEVIYLSKFATPPDCSIPWTLPLSGIAYDELIDPMAPPTRPNNNFDYYWVKVKQQGGTWLQIPIPGPGGTGFYGTSQVGNPGTACPGFSCDSANPHPMSTFGTLSVFDLRAVDPVCSASVGYPVPGDFLLPRGECCTYIFKVHARDRTLFSGGPHWDEDEWPVQICNDLPEL